jgi:hypothetical protein
MVPLILSISLFIQRDTIKPLARLSEINVISYSRSMGPIKKDSCTYLHTLSQKQHKRMMVAIREKIKFLRKERRRLRKY